MIVWVLNIGWLGWGWEKSKGCMLFHAVANFRKDGVQALSWMHRQATSEMRDWMETSNLGDIVSLQAVKDLTTSSEKLWCLWPHTLECSTEQQIFRKFPQLWHVVVTKLAVDVDIKRETYIRKAELCLYRLAKGVGWQDCEFAHDSKCPCPGPDEHMKLPSVNGSSVID